jgi:hypothetical protein
MTSHEAWFWSKDAANWLEMLRKKRETESDMMTDAGTNGLKKRTAGTAHGRWSSRILSTAMCTGGFYFRRKGDGIQQPGDTADHSLTYRSEVK